jgi:nucleolar MIF4G domain-containing protein 1
MTRKERRKAERSQKKQHHAPAKPTRPQQATRGGRGGHRGGRGGHSSGRGGHVANKGVEKPLRIVKADELEDDDDIGSSAFEDDEDEGEDGDLSLGEDESDEEESEPDTAQTKQPKISKTILHKLEEDDAEIAALEKKLGLKGRKKLPQSFHDEGLGELLGDLDEAQDEETQQKKKRKAEADEWLAQKRRKAEAAASAAAPKAKGAEKGEKPLRIIKAEDLEEDDDVGSSAFEDDDDDGSLLDGLEGDSEDDEEDEDMEGFDDEEEEDEGVDEDDNDFDGFDSDEAEDAPAAPKVRENPYVAPTSGPAVAKYVPPARRAAAGSDAELIQRIRRQLQGLVNRITESNMTGIVGDIEKVYREQPRQHVTTILVDLILIQVCDPTSLPDTLLILSAGFATALYKIIGMDFGAQLTQEIVERFDQYYQQAAAAPSPQEATKETSNIMTLLAEMYNLQLIGCNLIFDYIRFLLDNLTELNAELLLRIIRLAGPSLRQDDPLALKDIVTMIRPAVAKIGEANLSVRTKFMIETINDLKNNKMKTGIGASQTLSEHGTRMKKHLGSLNSRKLKATEPLRIGLKDIRESDKRGKWWLVGASWAGRSGDGGQATTDRTKKRGKDAEVESDDDDIILDGEDGGVPDLAELARENMMNTDVRRSIFVAVLSATDYEDAYVRLLKLRLNKDRQREIPNVLIQCAGAEQGYNPYYTLIAKRLCSDRKIRWSFQDALWTLFRRLGESIFGDDADDEDEDEAIDMRRLVNIAKMYGQLVADGALGLPLLKCLDLPYLQPKTRALVEVLFITAFLESYQAGDEKERRKAIERIMGSVVEVPELSRGIQWFVKKVVRKSDLAGAKEDVKKVKKVCAMAEEILEVARVQGFVGASEERMVDVDGEEEEEEEDL